MFSTLNGKNAVACDRRGAGNAGAEADDYVPKLARFMQV